MRQFTKAIGAASVCMVCASAFADVYHDYENFREGPIGESFTHEGVTYRDANTVSGYFPDGIPFGPRDLGNAFIIERADLFYNDFPDYGSRVNSLTFGRAFVPGPNLTIGPLASIWMDLEEVGREVSLDIAYYENGPWGGIEYVLEARRDDKTVATDSFIISDQGGRDNATFDTMSIRGVEFDTLHLYGWLGDAYTAPRGMIDDLAIALVPEPTTAVLLGLLSLLAWRRRR